MNRSLGLVPEMRNMEQAIAQENSLESKVELGLCNYFFSHVENKGPVRVWIQNVLQGPWAKGQLGYQPAVLLGEGTVC